MLQSFIALGVISLVWVLFGFSLAFGNLLMHGELLAIQMFAILNNPDSYNSNIPYLLFVFQLKFAIIAPAIITVVLQKEFDLELLIIYDIFLCFNLHSTCTYDLVIWRIIC